MGMAVDDEGGDGQGEFQRVCATFRNGIKHLLASSSGLGFSRSLFSAIWRGRGRLGGRPADGEHLGAHHALDRPQHRRITLLDWWH